MARYDYVVIGAGSAGSVVANRLTLLGQDVEIVVKPKSQLEEKACIHVILEGAH